MKITFLGTGTSVGVPSVGCDCSTCLSDDPRDKRLRTSVLLEHQGKNILIDASTDFRQQALRIGLKHLDKFAWVGGLSSAMGGKIGGSPSIGDSSELNAKLRLLWVSCGDKDTLFKGNTAFHDTLTEKKVNHIWHIDSGPHEWAVPRNDLYLLGAMLFREKK